MSRQAYYAELRTEVEELILDGLHECEPLGPCHCLYQWLITVSDDGGVGTVGSAHLNTIRPDQVQLLDLVRYALVRPGLSWSMWKLM